MDSSVYFCGDAIADLLEETSSGKFVPTLGGSSFYSALGAKNAVIEEGIPCLVGFIGSLSTDPLGQRFLETLKEKGIDTYGAARANRATTLAIVSIQPGRENVFSFYSQGTSVEGTTRNELPVTQNSARNIFCFGSISTVFEPARFAWLQFAKEHASQSVIYFDLNTRPTIAKDRSTYREIVKEWAQIAHVMKASDADIAWAYPAKTMQEVANLWLNEGAKIAVFTAGEKGSFAFTRNGMSFAESPSLIVGSTVGAGDNFNSGFAVNLVKENYVTPMGMDAIPHEPLRRILAGANQTAARHLISIGARENPGTPNP